MTDQVNRWLSDACFSRVMAWDSRTQTYDRTALLLAAENFQRACDILSVERVLTASELVEIAIETHELASTHAEHDGGAVVIAITLFSAVLTTLAIAMWFTIYVLP